MYSILTLFTYLRIIFITTLLGLGIYYLINIGNRFVEDEKRFRITRKEINYFILVIILFAIVYHIYKVIGNIMSLLLPFIYSIILAYLLNPIINKLEKKGINRTLGVLLVYLILVGIIVFISFSLIPKITDEFKNLITLIPSYFNQLHTYFNNLYAKYSKNIESLPPEFHSINQIIRENLNEVQTAILNTIGNVTRAILNIFSRVFSLIIIPIATFYFLKDKDFFKKRITLFIPKSYRHDVVKISKEVDLAIGRFIRGQLIVAAFVGIATALGLLILGIDFALIIGLIAGIANIIPYFGPIIGIIPAIIFAFLESPIKILWVIILFTVIQQIESNILSPKIVGESVGLHPVIVILSLLIGGSYFGIIGMLLAVPVAAIIKIITAFIIEKTLDI